MPDFYTVKEFAELIGAHTLTVQRWLKAGKIEGKKFEGRWRIPKSELDKVLPDNMCNTHIHRG